MSGFNLSNEVVTLSQVAGAILSFNPDVDSGQISFDTPFGPVSFNVNKQAPITKSLTSAGKTPTDASNTTLSEALEKITKGYVAVQRAKLTGIPYVYNAAISYSVAPVGFSTLGLIDVNININF